MTDTYRIGSAPNRILTNLTDGFYYGDMAWVDTFSEIEQGVPLPPERRSAGRGQVQAFLKSLNIGDSFTFTAESSNSACASVRHAAKALGFKIAFRSGEDSFAVFDAAGLTDKRLAKVRKLKAVRFVESNPTVTIQD